MSGYMGDLTNYFATQASTKSGKAARPEVKANNEKLEMNMQDFLMLMVTEMQHQSLDSPADTSEMLNQLVMMQMVSAMTNMTDTSIMGYAASLVGKTVTVGEFDADGKLQEIEGVVTGTGTMDGKQVVFVNDKYYYLSDILAVGKLPPKPETPEGGGKPEGDGKPEAGEKPEAGGTPDAGGSPDQGVTPPGKDEPAEKQLF